MSREKFAVDPDEVDLAGFDEKQRLDLIWLADSADRARAATLKRDRLLCELRSAGVTFRLLGECAGLSHTAVAKIVARS